MSYTRRKKPITLIITELSEYGIAMAADTAVTLFFSPTGKRRYAKVYRGAVKLVPVPKLNAGVSYWGLAQVGGVHTDDWLKNLFRRNRGQYASLKDLATLLQAELRKVVHSINLSKYPYGTIGMHLAGFVDTPNGSLPAFYHIHNGPSQMFPSVNPRVINANFDRPPQKYPHGMFYRTRNGDFRLYAVVFQALETLFKGLGQQFVIPDPNALHVSPLRARAEYLRFHIKTMAKIYEMSNVPVPGSIGEEVTTLTISDVGIQEYWTQ